MFFLSCFMCVCIFKYNCILLLGAHFQIQVVCIPAWCCVISYHCSLTSPTSSLTFPPSFLPPCPSSLTCTPHLSFFIPHLTSLTPHPIPHPLTLLPNLSSFLHHASSPHLISASSPSCSWIFHAYSILITHPLRQQNGFCIGCVKTQKC